MLGRRQEINLQLTELADSAILATSLWVLYVVRAYVLRSWFPNLEVIPPFKDFWVAAVLVPFTPIGWRRAVFTTTYCTRAPCNACASWLALWSGWARSWVPSSFFPLGSA